MKIALALPGTLRCLFVVAVERMPCSVESLVPWRVGPPYRKAAMTAFGTPRLAVTHHRSPWRPAGLALTDDERHLLRRARHHLLVTTTAPPHELPANVQVARATARALARACGGLVIDPLTGTTIPTCDRCPDEPPRFRLADDWLGWDIHPRLSTRCCPPRHPADSPEHTTATTASLGPTPEAGRSQAPAPPRDSRHEAPHASTPPRDSTHDAPHAFMTMCDPARRAGRRQTPATRPAPASRAVHAPASKGARRDEAAGDTGLPDPAEGGETCDCLSVTSRGLRRFALPEITIEGTACAHSLCATSLLRTVADRLLTDHLAFLSNHRKATIRLIDDHLHLNGSDQSPFPGTPSFGVQLTPCDDHTPALTYARRARHPQEKAASTRPRGVRRLKVRPMPGTGQFTCLKVAPPSGFTGSLDAWPRAPRKAGHNLPPMVPLVPLAGCRHSNPPGTLAA
ncbi:hypothetical protein [Nonomuraea lactucae]|uniref:hypothetical protein n=1 Tax=Nonomuraea lactucae TaxID=2249762 RepID=UPI0013B3BCFF|nr:hypothetical protein [Nonomuraea lactucae]